MTTAVGLRYYQTLSRALSSLCAAVICLLFCAGLPAIAGDAALAPAPPMGWNSWDSYGRTINETQFKNNAHWMAKHLKRFGWQYVVIDEGWYISNPEINAQDYKFLLSKDGRFVPAPNRFPSAANDAGFRPLADFVHSLGLKLGIHIIRGIPREAVARNLPIADSRYYAQDAADPSDTCPWNAYNYGVKSSEAGQAYYDSVIKLYAIWHVDFIKVDCIADHPYKPDDIRMLAIAIKKTGWPIVLSLSPGPTALSNAAEVSKYAEMWRICDDFWDHWGSWEKHEWSQSLYQQFATTAKWASLAAPGDWPDADMLPLGHLGPHPGDGELRETRFTRDEQRTMMTLWSIVRSPLVMGGDLPSSDKWTKSLLSNPEVIAVDQQSSGNHAVVSTDKVAIWLAQPDRKHGYYLAVFNLSDNEQTVDYEWIDLGLTQASYRMRDLWGRKNTGPKSSLTVGLRPHASKLYLIGGDH
ncbi:MAG: glycoside hydrolase family 27 protein [Terriglobales bacterium]